MAKKKLAQQDVIADIEQALRDYTSTTDKEFLLGVDLLPCCHGGVEKDVAFADLFSAVRQYKNLWGLEALPDALRTRLEFARVVHDQGTLFAEGLSRLAQYCAKQGQLVPDGAGLLVFVKGEGYKPLPEKSPLPKEHVYLRFHVPDALQAETDAVAADLQGWVNSRVQRTLSSAAYQIDVRKYDDREIIVSIPPALTASEEAMRKLATMSRPKHAPDTVKQRIAHQLSGNLTLNNTEMNASRLV